MKRTAFDKLMGKLGYRRKSEDAKAASVYLHNYAGGYDEYRAVQIAHNKRKLDEVWADESVLGAIAAYLERQGRTAPLSGLCHGARNGYEVAWFRERLGGETIGTDISDTATQFPNMVVWDFHEPNPDWSDAFDFVYTNSLDQAMDPSKALAAWAAQIRPNGHIFIEHTMAHSARNASEMDPFGAHPMAMPYLFFQWGRGKYHLAEIIELDAKSNKGIPAWVFVLRRT